ncbi:MAG: hypothetical protein JW779_08150 [Candidatus Thorarchaeota archaeon]|nr:hypothetical protein [Candidatus Thorarchaeota archaeon]
MGLEVLLIGTVLFVASIMLFLVLHHDVSAHLENEKPFYFMMHPKLFQMIFYMMFWAFPINLGIVVLLYTESISIHEAGGIITFIFLMWPTFTYFFYRSLRGLSLKLGLVTGPSIESDPVLIAKLKMTGWIGSLFSFVALLFIKLSETETILEVPLLFFSFFGVPLLLPSRKSLAIIRGNQLEKNTKS